ncbi:tRNA pseudouridine(55) synthase TruB [Terasakiispira papahanaumokuakeensis]|uniref:tRNA pseudouridine synthase B n=1 Tax=Terasakiispira papahanaumokuakeensis TaxID=197479 RepID=A0A1E2VDX6_9GAMM|nr:tRNA pseudouridine(55) synthase TruB [Terasakiispira papahanaumokuakeensis]ODC04865.1 tRNA pseudouridine(55) synthase TruB [Terasakiispira papahanaumokuakeensis]
MARRPKGRSVSGVLLLDKPQGLSSNQALQRVRWMLNAAKAGHTGNLDPMATGVLPICLGEATKFAQLGLDADKTYLAQVQLGACTDTGDADGQVTTVRPVPALTPELLEAALAPLRGDIMQVPPMYSALKQDGRKLYELARAGQEVERPPRPVTIYALDLLDHTDDQLTIRVACSKGTYIRVLGESIGEHLGCGAHLTGLRRLRSGQFDAQSVVSLETLQQHVDQAGDREAAAPELDAYLLPVDVLLTDYPALTLDATQAKAIRYGQKALDVDVKAAIGDNVRLYAQAQDIQSLETQTQETPAQIFLGLGRVDQRRDGGQVIAPARLLNTG